MPTYEEIKTQVSNLSGAAKFLASKELKALPGILWHDENVEMIVQGLYGKGFGILVATNKRVIFVDKGLLFGLRVEDFPYDKISSIQYETGLIYGTMTIFTSGNRALIERVNKQNCRNFGDYVRARITKQAENHSFVAAPIIIQPAPTDNKSAIDQLERLAKLKESGLLTEDEFNKEKGKILNK